MIRPPLHITFVVSAALIFTGCAHGGLGNPSSNVPNYQPFPGQGQYVRPDYLEPTLPPRIPREDLCRSRLYVTLEGQHEGSVFIAGLPGRKRIVKPASLEEFDTGDNDFIPPPPLVEVINFLPQQSIYAPSIRTVTDRFLLSDDDESRLTLELDADGYIQDVRCG